MLGLDVRALPAAVIRVPSCANAAVYPASSFEFRKVRMSNIERSAKKDLEPAGSIKSDEGHEGKSWT